MELSIRDVPELISLLFLVIVLLLMGFGVTAPEYISSGVAAVFVAELIDFWTSRQSARLSETEMEAIRVLKSVGKEAGYEEVEQLLSPLIAKYTFGELLESLKNKKAVKEFRRDGARLVKLRFRARVL